MNRRIRGLAIALLLCFALLFVQMNVLQVAQKSCPGLATPLTKTGCRDDLAHDPTNNRTIVRDFSQPRGTVTTADGVVLAKSVPVNDQFKYLRQFPAGDLYGPITGYYNFTFGASGLEKQYNDQLSGQTARQQYRSLSDLFVTRDHTGNLSLTIRNDLQTQARQVLADAETNQDPRFGKQGAAIVLDPRDGSILAMYSDPTFDPNPLSTHDQKQSTAAKTLLDAAKNNPLLARTYRETYAPGSTMKLVTASTGVDSGKVTPDTPRFPVESQYQPPYGKPIGNFSGESCGGTLFEVLAESCNSSFARMGAETIGPQTMIAGAQHFGFDQVPPIDLPGAVPSNFPTDFTGQLPLLAQASIGQGDVRATPLEMALVAAGIANGGTIMAPHLLHEIRDKQGDVVDRYSPKAWKQAISGPAAATMRQAMIGVVQNGTATVLDLPGYDVGAKTGTAEVATGANPTNNAWMVAWAGPKGQHPTVVVAVLIPNVRGVGNASTGAAVAGKAAKQLLQSALADQGGGH